MGVPALNEVHTIRRVTEIAGEGLAAIPHDSEIWLADGGSSDGTVDRFLGTQSRIPLTVFVDNSVPGGKGRNVLAMVSEAVEKSVDALVLIDADVTSTQPEWIAMLAAPVTEGRADYVSAVFAASQGGPLRHLVSRPLVYGFAGGDVSQPTGGEVCLSLNMCRRVIDEAVTDPAVLGYGIDIHLALECIGAEMPFAQAELGVKRHRARPWSTITFIAREVATAGFQQLRRHRDRVLRWSSPAVPTTPLPSDNISTAALDPAVLDLKSVRRRFLATRDEHSDLYRRLLHDERDVLWEVQRATAISGEAWRTVIARFAGDAVIGGDAERLASALMPLMLGRMVSFGEQLLESPADLNRSLNDDLVWIASNRPNTLGVETRITRNV